MAAFLYGAFLFSGYMGFFGKTQNAAASWQISEETAPKFRNAVFTDQQVRPVGTITYPPPNAITYGMVTIFGHTENVPIDTPFVWLIVDVPSIGRCWPKKPLIQPNGSFQATIFEGGPNMDYTVSLYAVGYGLNNTIGQWLAVDTFGGLPMIPLQYRLDSVRLSLRGGHLPRSLLIRVRAMVGAIGLM